MIQIQFIFISINQFRIQNISILSSSSYKKNSILNKKFLEKSFKNSIKNLFERNPTNRWGLENIIVFLKTWGIKPHKFSSLWGGVLNIQYSQSPTTLFFFSFSGIQILWHSPFLKNKSSRTNCTTLVYIAGVQRWRDDLQYTTATTRLYLQASG